MNYVDVAEFAKLSGKSEQYIRRLCKENKLQYMQEYVEQNGKHKYMIEISTPAAKKIMTNINNVSDQKEEYVSNQGTKHISMPVAFDSLVVELVETRKKIEEYALEAGQAKLLVDNLVTKEIDVKYWQDKYFEKENEVRVLTKLNAQLESANKLQMLRNEQTQQEILQMKAQLEKKPFLSFFRR